MIELVYETHSTSVDNEAGVASGWADCALSELGRRQASELGNRRRDDGLDAVFASDLRRVLETAAIAFGETDLPLFVDWRLRECGYGDLTRSSGSELHARRVEFLRTPHPGGESWAQAVERVGWFLDDLRRRWDGSRVLVLGSIATRWGLWHHLDGVSLEELCSRPFAWQPGWEFRIDR